MNIPKTTARKSLGISQGIYANYPSTSISRQIPTIEPALSQPCKNALIGCLGNCGVMASGLLAALHGLIQTARENDNVTNDVFWTIAGAASSVQCISSLKEAYQQCFRQGNATALEQQQALMEMEELQEVVIKRRASV